MNDLISPPADAIFYEDERLYCCLASYPLTKGHSVVVWKDKVTDLHLLNKVQYEYLAWIVDKARNDLLKTLNLEKVYLMYMDEISQVHWHLVPRYNEKGFNILKHEPKKLNDFSLAIELKNNWPNG